MSEIKYFCPQCYAPEIKIEGAMLVADTTAQCELCGWRGSRSDLLAAISPANSTFWTAERVAQALLSSAARYAAVPLIQVLESLGLVPALSGSTEEQLSAAEVREGVMKAVLAAVVTASFEAAAELSPRHYERFNSAMHQQLEQVFSFAGVSDGS